MKFHLFHRKAPASGSLPRSLLSLSPPHPVLARGWLHARQGHRPWMIERIATVMGRRQWLSHRGESFGPDGQRTHSTLVTIAGFWPIGGFIELQMGPPDLLEVPPSGDLVVYAADPDAAERVFVDLTRHYMYRGSSLDARPRIGFLNERGGGEQVPAIAEGR